MEELAAGTRVFSCEWTDSKGKTQYIERGDNGCVSLYIAHMDTGRSYTVWVVDINEDGETQLHNVRFMSSIRLVKDLVE